MGLLLRSCRNATIKALIIVHLRERFGKCALFYFLEVFYGKSEKTKKRKVADPDLPGP